LLETRTENEFQTFKNLCEVFANDIDEDNLREIMQNYLSNSEHEKTEALKNYKIDFIGYSDGTVAEYRLRIQS
jgi:hypothetical protein